jgi:phospholipase C
MSRLALAAPLALAMLGAHAGPALVDAATPEPATATPIQHLVVLMQENHTFDNYFGTYPGADGIPAGTCMPVDPAKGATPCVEPFAIRNRPVLDLGHSQEVFAGEFNGGGMDGFVAEHQRASSVDGSLAMGYYDDRDIPFYWNVADNFVLFDRFFSSAGAGSVWNHMYWVTGTPGNPAGDSIPAEGFGDLPTIFDRLEAKGISWKFYINNYDPNITYRSSREELTDRGSQPVWAPVLDYARYLDDPELSSHIVDLQEYYTDLQLGTLPAVSYVVPSGASEHPPGSVQAGEQFVRTLINALMRSSAWSSSAFMWTYDDWGGWYDHVVPPKVDAYGYGFRVPAMLVSAYARRGYIDHTTLDFTSFLKFIEENWGVEPLADRDAKANSFVSAFDFSNPPRDAAFLSSQRGAPAPSDPSRLVLYVAYFGALLFAGAVIAYGVLSTGGLRVHRKRVSAWREAKER